MGEREPDRDGEQIASPKECFRQALDVARGQQAKSLELRATMGLSRWWERQSKRDEARQWLAEL
jgi:hypothetical protein